MAPRWSSTGVGQYVASERHTAWLPKQYKPDGTRRGVLYFPPKGQTAINVFTDYMAAAIVDAGLPVVSFDLGNIDGTTPKWGSGLGIARAASAWTYAQTAFGFKTDGFLGYGGSHGGISQCNFARSKVAGGSGSEVKALALVIPTLDLPYVYDNDVGTSAAGIDAAYTNHATYVVGLPTHNPSAYAASLSVVPQHIVYSTDDTFTPAASTLAYAAAAGAVLQSQGAVGHTVTIDPAETVAFLLAHA